MASPGALLLCLEAVIIPIGILISNRRSESYGSAFVQSVDGMSMHPLLILTYCVMAPLMMLYLFQFLNKRAASDFYHAIPNSRVSLFFSFFAAVMTWLAAAAVVSTLLSLAGFLLLGPAVAVNGFSLLILLFNSMAACLFVCGAVAVAMCVTGTLFTNVTVSLLIIFMPRLLLAVFCSTLQEMLPMISSLYFIPPLDSQYNVVTNLLFGAFNGNADLSFTFLGGGIYTLSIGALYTGLASWLFYRRKSETAGKAAPNRALQTLYRLLVSMLVCLFPCVFIASAILNREALDGESLFTYAVFYLGAVLVYFLYELFTTRKWRNLLRAVPALGILLLMNAAFTGGIVAAYYSTLDIRPQAGDMEAVRFINRSDNDYFSIKTSTVKIRDPAMQEIVAQRLNYTLELAKDSPQAYYDAQNDLSMTAQQVAVYLPGRTLYRNLLFSSRDLNDIAGILGRTPLTGSLPIAAGTPQRLGLWAERPAGGRCLCGHAPGDRRAGFRGLVPVSAVGGRALLLPRSGIPPHRCKRTIERGVCPFFRLCRRPFLFHKHPARPSAPGNLRPVYAVCQRKRRACAGNPAGHGLDRGGGTADPGVPVRRPARSLQIFQPDVYRRRPSSSAG